MDNKDDRSMEEIQREFFHTLSWYFSEKYKPDSFLGSLNRIHDELKALNNNLVESSKSSEKLSNALNKLTFWGVLIAGLGVLIALGNLMLELGKHFKLVI